METNKIAHEVPRNFTLNNGISIPSIGFGTYKLPDDDLTAEIVGRAVADGYRNIDCASFYANQAAIGLGIAGSGVGRSDLFVSSKVWNTDRGYDSTLRAFEATLGQLGFDYLDLYLIHWPASPSQTDRWEEINRSTWKAMERLVDEHAVRAIGVCNFRPRHLQSMLATANILPSINQIEYHPGEMQRPTVDYCRDHDILIEAWSPLARGRMFENPVLLSIAERHDRTVAQIALRWELQHGVLPIPKSATPSRIAQNIDVYDFALSPDEMAAIDALDGLDSSALDPDTIAF